MPNRNLEHTMIPSPIDLTPRVGARLAAGLLGALSAVAAVAHPGHDATPAYGFFEGLVHLLTEPDHLAALAIAVVLGMAGATAWRARRTTGRTERRDPTPHRH
jgi:hydrogenase/urease accessory protein HupE